MKKLKVKGVLFDLWGTLIYNNPPALRLTSLANPIGVEPDDLWKAWRRYMVPALKGEVQSGEERAERVLRDLGRPLDYVHKLAEYERKSRATDIHFYKGVPDMLAELHKRGYKTAVVSNTTYVARPVVERLKIAEKVDTVILSCDVGLVKPDLEIYRLGARKLGLETSECLFVGDGGDNELSGAMAAGCVVAVVQQERGFAYRNPDNLPAEIEIQLPGVIDVLGYL